MENAIQLNNEHRLTALESGQETHEREIAEIRSVVNEGFSKIQETLQANSTSLALLWQVAKGMIWGVSLTLTVVISWLVSKFLGWL